MLHHCRCSWAFGHIGAMFSWLDLSCSDSGPFRAGLRLAVVSQLKITSTSKTYSNYLVHTYWRVRFFIVRIRMVLWSYIVTSSDWPVALIRTILKWNHCQLNLKWLQLKTMANKSYFKAFRCGEQPRWSRASTDTLASLKKSATHREWTADGVPIFVLKLCTFRRHLCKQLQTLIISFWIERDQKRVSRPNKNCTLDPRIVIDVILAQRR